MTNRLELGVLWVRGGAVGWAVLTLVTFGSLSVSPGNEFAAARPIFIGGTALSALFLVLLSWPLKRDIRGRLPRVLTTLQWQLATGVVIAFTVGADVRQELQIAFYLYGAYLVISGAFYMALKLIEQRLARAYVTADEAARKAELASITESVASAVVQTLAAGLPVRAVLPKKRRSLRGGLRYRRQP